MNKLLLGLIFLFAVGFGFFYYQSLHQKSNSTKSSQNSSAEKPINIKLMKISSTSFTNNQAIPKKYTCDADNINPPLSFADIPEAAKSLVLIMDDPDAPVGIWVHWTLWNLSPDIKEIAENSVPQGAIQGLTSSGQNVYGGPCPPAGTHRYYFKLYALDSKLTIPSFSTAEDLTKAMEGHILADAELIGLYNR